MVQALVENEAASMYLVQPHDVSLKDGQRLGVDGLPMVCPASQNVPPPPVSLSQGDTQRVG